MSAGSLPSANAEKEQSARFTGACLGLAEGILLSCFLTKGERPIEGIKTAAENYPPSQLLPPSHKLPCLHVSLSPHPHPNTVILKQNTHLSTQSRTANAIQELPPYT